jgi:hypothetical protein
MDLPGLDWQSGEPMRLYANDHQGEGRLANEPAHPLPPSESDLDFDAKDHHNQQQENKRRVHLLPPDD